MRSLVANNTPGHASGKRQAASGKGLASTCAAYQAVKQASRSITIVTLKADDDVNSSDDAFWTGSAFTPGRILTTQPGFSDGKATVGVRITDGAGTPVDDSFHLFVAYKD